MKDVVILEDDVEQAELLALNLKAAGHKPRIARSAEEATKLIKEDVPDAVVADVLIKTDGNYVPDGAIRLLHIIRRDFGLKDLPVYVVTGADPSLVKMLKETCDTYNVTGFLPKPYDMRELARWI